MKHKGKRWISKYNTREGEITITPVMPILTLTFNKKG
jgi:hypothetical protein